jgi:GT2 family glycosyltransferase
MAFSTRLSVSIIIPVHNGGESFKRCVGSVLAADPQPKETIVVADGDTDGSWRIAEAHGLTVLKLPTPGGPARARNVGARSATGDILFFVDADVTIPPDAVRQVAAVFQNEHSVAGVFGSYDDEPSEHNFLSQYKNLLHHYVHQTAQEKASTFWGACGAIRRDVFLNMGGFDEGYRTPSVEDIEFGYRLKKAGYAIRLVKGLRVKHLKRWTIRSLLKADFFFRALPWTKLILKEGRFINDLNVDRSGRLSVLCIYLFVLALAGALYESRLIGLTVVFVLVLLALNWDLYRFFKAKRGLAFAVKAIPWHWAYFFYSGLAFSFGFVEHYVRRALGDSNEKGR